MKNSSNASAIRGYSFLKVFADYDGLNAEELAFIEKLAMQDGSVDEAERKTLAVIFEKAACIGMEPAVAAEVAQFKQRHQIP